MPAERRKPKGRALNSDDAALDAAAEVTAADVEEALAYVRGKDVEAFRRIVEAEPQEDH